MPPPPVQKSVLVARSAIPRGQILKPTDFAWQVWPDSDIDQAYIQKGARTIEDFAGWVARDPFGPGEPITEGKVVAPGSRGFLAAVLRPGMRAVSVPVTATSGISGFVFPGDQVDIVVSETLPAPEGNGDAVPAQGEPRRFCTTYGCWRSTRSSTTKRARWCCPQRNARSDAKAERDHRLRQRHGQVVAQSSQLTCSLRARDRRRYLTSGADAGTSTLDSEVSRLFPKPFTQKDNPGADVVTILRGTGKSELVLTKLQPASRGL